MNKLAKAILAIGLVALCHPAGADDARSADSADGEALFEQYACYTCHGYHGAGRTPLDPATSGILASEAAFLRYLRLRGDQQPINPSNSMPHYSETMLSDAAARRIFAYLVSLDDDPPAVDDIAAFRELLDDADADPEYNDEFQ